ncbi:MAG: HEPN domain-containing protein, partial [Candidatus Margulisiibacteriota bacterium]
MGEKRLALVAEWLKKADNDLRAAILIFDKQEDNTDNVCFHCQQAAEKYLKSYLISLGIDFPKTHSLSHLSTLIGAYKSVPDAIIDLLEGLESYSVEVRYPTGFMDRPYSEAKDALDAAIEIQRFFKGFL